MDVKERMDIKLIQPFIDATIHVLKTMAFTEASASKPYLKNNKIAKGDVSGVIGITGDSIGSLSVSFPEKSILTIVSDMFGENMTIIDDEIKDAVGEITNMISGQARQKLESAGISLDAAIPTVISGQDHSIKHITSYPIVAVTFVIDQGEFVKGDDKMDFTIEVCIEDKK